MIIGLKTSVWPSVCVIFFTRVVVFVLRRGGVRPLLGG
jgi:hypothetical protein